MSPSRLNSLKSACLRLALFACLGGALPAEAQLGEVAADENEISAYAAATSGRYVRARELASEILRERPRSAPAQLSLGVAFHEGEGNVPLALHHYRQARRIVEGPAGFALPGQEELHRRVLLGEWRALSDLGRYEELLEVTAALRRLYDSNLHSVDVWPLMKLGRIEDARAAIDRALATGDPFEEVVARNGLCALDGYAACQAMLRSVRGHEFNPGLALRNAAVSAFEFGELEESERLLVESTRHVDEQANPWRDLADLYMTQARLAEAAGAARRMVELGRSLPPRERQSSRGEELVTSAKLLLLVGDTDRALASSRAALDRPDRAAHWSGNAAELGAEGALLHRAIRKTIAEKIAEDAALGPWYLRPAAGLAGSLQRARGWLAARRAVPILLAGALRPKSDPSDRDTPELSGSTWLMLDAVELFGAGPTLSLVDSVRADLGTTPPVIPGPLFEARLDAIATEAHFLARNDAACLSTGRQARSALPPGQVLLKSRLAARMAECAQRLGRVEAAGALYEEVLRDDPGALRRLGQALPVRIGRGAPPAAARAVIAGPRFSEETAGPFELRAGSSGSLCLVGLSGGTVACGAAADAGNGEEPPHLATARNLVENAFDPRIDLSQQDLESLDGAPVSGRTLDLGPLGDLADPNPGRSSTDQPRQSSSDSSSH